jgi:hypothetical protein
MTPRLATALKAPWASAHGQTLSVCRRRYASQQPMAVQSRVMMRMPMRGKPG